MKKLVLGLLALGFTTQFTFSQVEELPAVSLDVNEKYLNAVESEVEPIKVRLLEKEVAYFNLKASDFYNEDVPIYKVYFHIPEGRIMAFYNQDGEIINTIEKFQNVDLPESVITALAERYPLWTVSKDRYVVHYNDVTGVTKNEFKVKLKNGDRRLTVNVNHNGDFK